MDWKRPPFDEALLTTFDFVNTMSENLKVEDPITQEDIFAIKRTMLILARMVVENVPEENK